MTAAIAQTDNIVPLGRALDPGERLSRAVRLLDRALEQNRRSVADLTLTLDQLGARVCGIEAGLLRYQNQIGHLAARIDRLGLESRRLMALMDQVIETHAEGVLPA